MTETLLVRAAGGSWEELRPRTTVPEGGVAELFGDDLAPVLGVAEPVLVAACEPTLASASPDAICIDPSGGIWVVQLALGGDGADALPRLLTCAGALTGMDYAAFEAACDRRGAVSLAEFAGKSGGSSFQAATFERSIAAALAHGRVRLVAIVRSAAPALVQSMRFLNASGASGLVYEASSFASESVSAIRARAVDVGDLGGRVHLVDAESGPAFDLPEADPGSDGGDLAVAAPTPAQPAEAPRVDAAAAAFIDAVAAATDASTAELMEQLRAVCAAQLEEVAYDGDSMRASLAGAPIVTAAADGGIVLSFEAIGAMDPNWSVRDELCQGMERLLGTDLGDVRKISQLNLSIGEHLMDSTLMEALGDLLVDTVAALRAQPGAAGRARGRAATAA